MRQDATAAVINTHTVTTTPTVGTPVFTLAATSSRCFGAGNITYAATSSNSTGLSYSLDGTSLSAGNSINTTTGAVTYVAGWIGTTVITATSTGCNGPSTSTHTVTVNGSVMAPVFTFGSTSNRCQAGSVVTYTAISNYASGITYSLDAPSISAGNSIVAATGAVTFKNSWFGTSTVTASAACCNGPVTSTHIVTTTASVGTPTFSLGSSSTVCQNPGQLTYTASAGSTSGITYSLDGSSLSGGNTINSSNGTVNWSPSWSGTSTVTASAAGCSGPLTANHVVTLIASVGTPVFSLGAASTVCQNPGSVTYGASASTTSGISYSLDAASLSAGNTINTSGRVSYTSAWSGTSIITASAAGCNGPKTAIHSVTITPTVGTPVFTLGSTSSRCTGAATINYGATASNATGITYTLDNSSKSAGNTINAATGSVTYTARYGTSTITATAAGCNGPKTSTHTATVTPNAGTVSFVLGASSSRCQGAGAVTYTATSTPNNGLSYSLDATSLSAGNTIDAVTGVVTYTSSWTGASLITASTSDCIGTKSATHTATTNAPVDVPVFAMGSSSTRCQSTNNVLYNASANYTTGITYSIDAASTGGGNTIIASTGDLDYSPSWSGTTIVTASAAGCLGPKTATHTISITATVGTPVFAMGASSTRCQGSGTVSYPATATTSTGINYSLNAASLSAGNTINAATGDVTYTSGYSGSTIITASAAGCNGPKTSTHNVTVTATVGIPVFTWLSSTRCQGAGTVTYTATATTSTAITYSLDATALAAGNTIVAATGAVSYSAGWTGNAVITATASGCNICPQCRARRQPLHPL